MRKSEMIKAKQTFEMLRDAQNDILRKLQGG